MSLHNHRKQTETITCHTQVGTHRHFPRCWTVTTYINPISASKLQTEELLQWYRIHSSHISSARSICAVANWRRKPSFASVQPNSAYHSRHYHCSYHSPQFVMFKSMPLSRVTFSSSHSLGEGLTNVYICYSYADPFTTCKLTLLEFNIKSALDTGQNTAELECIWHAYWTDFVERLRLKQVDKTIDLVIWHGGPITKKGSRTEPLP